MKGPLHTPRRSKDSGGPLVSAEWASSRDCRDLAPESTDVLNRGEEVSMSENFACKTLYHLREEGLGLRIENVVSVENSTLPIPSDDKATNPVPREGLGAIRIWSLGLRGGDCKFVPLE